MSARPKLTAGQRAEQMLELKAARLREHALENRARIVDEANLLLRGFGSALAATVDDQGTITLRLDRRVVFSASPCAKTLAKGTLAQPTAAHLQNLAESSNPQSIEARLAAVIRATFPHGVSSRQTDASRVAALLVRVFWPLAEDDVTRAVVQLRKVSPATRANAAKIVGSAGVADSSVGLRFGRQAINIAPVLASLAEDHRDLGEQIASGVSIKNLATELGAGREVMALHGWATSLVTRTNAGDIERTLAMLRSHGVSLPGKAAESRRFIASIIELRGIGASASDEFGLWALKHRAERVQLGIKSEPVDLSTLCAWASATAQSDNGWRPTLAWDEACGRAIAAGLVTEEPFGGKDEDFAQRFSPVENHSTGWIVRAASNARELWSWGQALKVCLGKSEFHAHYAAGIRQRSFLIVGVFRLVGKPKQPRIVSVAELNEKELALVQHRAMANQRPGKAARDALDHAVAAEVTGRVRAGEM